MISKQTQKALSYVFALLVVVLGTIILVALAQGYHYDFLTGQIKESGLVLIDSQPNNADIYINGKRSKYRTPQRIADANVGPMTVELVRPDFRVWKKSFFVQAQEVSFVDYALLLPQKLSYGSFLPDYKISEMAQTLDRRKSLILTTKPTAAIWNLDGNQTPTLYYQAPTNSGDVALNGMQLSPDGGAVIVSQRLGSQTSLLELSGGSSPTVTDLTAQFQISTGQLVFNPDNNREIFWLNTDGALRKLSLDNKSLGAVLADNVASMQVENGRLFYVTRVTETSPLPQLWSLDLSSQRKTKLAVKIPVSASYKLDYVKSRSVTYLALLATDTKQLLVINNPLSSAPVPGVLSKTATNFSISKSGTYIVYNAEDSLRSYDVDLAARANFKVSLKGLQDWRWLDPEHILVLANNQLRLIDYDGQNDQIISDVGDVASSFAIDTNSKGLTFISSGGVRTVSLVQN